MIFNQSKEFMKRLNLFAILLVGCISPWMFSLEKAQTQVLTECQPDQYGNIIDLGDGACNHTIQSKPEVSFFELINTLNQTSGFSSFFQYFILSARFLTGHYRYISKKKHFLKF